MRVGSKKEVFYSEEPMKTAGGLLKQDLRKNKRGRIVSIKRSEVSELLINLAQHLITFTVSPLVGCTAVSNFINQLEIIPYIVN